jgi:hypothetical protein
MCLLVESAFKSLWEKINSFGVRKMKKNKFEILNTNQKQKEWNYMNSVKNITLGWVPTCGPHMSEADAARSCLPIGPTVSLRRICS